MGILNATPDSFSDGGRFGSPDDALAHAEAMIADGADLIDVGGESTRPGSRRVGADEEISRVVPLINAISRRFDIPISVDTSKDEVARAALDAGAEIVNDISGLRFDPRIAETARRTGAGLVLMHLRGEFESMHAQPETADALAEVARGWRESLTAAAAAGVDPDRIVLDAGIGFGKSASQNLQLIARLGRFSEEFGRFPLLVGASRKSFIGKALGEPDPADRLAGSLVAAAIAVWNGARVVRVHDVKESVRSVRMAEALRSSL
jgi:dihydropteroate synthase